MVLIFTYMIHSVGLSQRTITGSTRRPFKFLETFSHTHTHTHTGRPFKFLETFSANADWWKSSTESSKRKPLMLCQTTFFKPLKVLRRVWITSMSFVQPKSAGDRDGIVCVHEGQRWAVTHFTAWERLASLGPYREIWIRGVLKESCWNILYILISYEYYQLLTSWLLCSRWAVWFSNSIYFHCQSTYYSMGTLLCM